MESNDRRKKFGLRRMINSVTNSFAGLVIAYKNEQSMIIHFVASLLLFALSIGFNISRIEWLFVILIIGSTAAAELFNTSIENVTDLATSEIHPLAKAAKDTSSAAEFVLVLMSFLLALFIFIPKIIAL